MNNANKILSAATLAALTLSTTLTHAQPAGELVDSAEVEAQTEKDTTKVRGSRRHVRMALEATGMLAIGTAWYWRKDEATGQFGGANHVDWQLGFKGNSITKKLSLSSEGWRFDGNSFGLNALGHPMFGALTYFSARKNNYGVAESFVISTLASGAWELLTEWAEYGSINDALSTSTTGVPLGEAAYQLMHNWRKTRYAVQASAGSQNGDAFTSLGGRVALDTTPTEGSGMVVGGNKISAAVEVPFDGAVRSVEGGAKTSLVGYYKNGENYKLFAGASAEFYYRDLKDRDSRDWDLLSTVSAGPTFDIQMRRGDVTIDAGTDIYLDFGMLKAAAFESWRADNQMELVRNSMQDKAQPYYYARGVTVDPRINVGYRGFNIGGKLALSKFDSLDGADRDQEMITDDSHMSDTDTSAEAWLGYTHKSVTLAVDGRVHGRSGSMADHTAKTSDTTTMVTLAYQR